TGATERRSSRVALRQASTTTRTLVGITAGELASTSRPITTGTITPPSWAAANTMAVDPRAPGAARASQARAVGNTGPRASPVRVYAAGASPGRWARPSPAAAAGRGPRA